VAPAARLLQRMGEEAEARLRSARGLLGEGREETAR
jgi:hypothetical protein